MQSHHGIKKFFTTSGCIAVFLIMLAAMSIASPTASAQVFGIANNYEVADQEIVAGDIVAESPGVGLVRAEISYDTHLFGVATEKDKALIVFQAAGIDPATSRSISQSGEAMVNVTTYDGTIFPGDYVTSSPVAGKGMKAVDSGYVLGIATSNFVPTGTMSVQGRTLQTGQVRVSLGIQFIQTGIPGAGSFLKTVSAAFLTDIQTPGKFNAIFRYVLGGILALSSFMFGFLTFSRSVAKGIEAIGRNPLARASIQASIVFQIFMTVITSAVGVVIAFVIIRL